MAALGNDSAQAESLRAALTRHLVAEGTIRDERVAAAFRSGAAAPVRPVHAARPRVRRRCRADEAEPGRRGDQLGVAAEHRRADARAGRDRPGDQVLEIGSGGYNAALMRELTGPKGSVTTVDIDPEVTARARALLDQAGYDDVLVVRADGEYGVPGQAPYDRIVVTVTAWDIPLAWIDQLRPGGRIVVPLRVRGQTRAIAFDRVDGHLDSRSTTLVRIRLHARGRCELRAAGPDQGRRGGRLLRRGSGGRRASVRRCAGRNRRSGSGQGWW